ncbi:hypothetical protein BH24ACI5_BH24ACI5_15920 [soil metagenome]
MYLGMLPFLAAAWICLSTAQEQKPAFKTGVELVPVDVQVVDRDGRPIGGLKAEDFEVTIDGRKRPVVSVELLQYASANSASPGGTAPVAAVAGASGTPSRRLYVIGVDEHSIRFGSARAAMEASKRFIAQLGPDDLVGLVAYPTGATRVDPTTDHAQVLAALDQVGALFEPPQTRYNISAAEALDMVSNNSGTAGQVVDRECPETRDSSTKIECGRLVRMEGQALGLALEATLSQSLSGLRGLLSDTRSTWTHVSSTHSLNAASVTRSSAMKTCSPPGWNASPPRLAARSFGSAPAVAIRHSTACCSRRPRSICWA